MSRSRTHGSMPAALLLLAAVACGSGGRDEAGAPPASDTVAAAAPASVPLAEAAFKEPESVFYDSVGDVYFVSNLNGGAGAASNQGFISRVRPDGAVDSLHFVQGGRGGVTLNAPRGLAIVGNTLWVADSDALRAFDRRDGRFVGNIVLTAIGARSLKDLTFGGDSALYASDTEANRIFRVGADLKPTTPVAEDSLDGPVGLLWDGGRDGRLLIASFRGDAVQAWSGSDSSLTTLARGAGGFDGLARLADGRIAVSSHATGSIYVLDGDSLSVLSEQPGVSGLGSDPGRHRLLLTVPAQNRVRFLDVPGN